MRMASAQIEKILKIYKSVAQNPALISARITWVNESGITVQSTWSQRNLERRISQKFSREHILKPDLQVANELFPVDVSTELASALFEDGQKKAILRSGIVDNVTKQFIEIWDRQRLVKNYDLSALDVHGDVYTDSEFGSFEWSPDATKLLYVAEKKLPKCEPFYKQKPLDKKEKKEEDEVSRGNEYVFKPHWGEQLVGKHRPVVVVLNTNDDTLTVQTGIAENLSPGQVIWTPEGDGIVGVAWMHEPRYLGLMHCSNRESWIFLLKNGDYRNLSDNGCAVRSPRFSPDGKHLIWLERESGGPHHNAHRLMHLKWTPELGKSEILVDIVRNNKTINFGKKFYGLFNRGFPKRCWSSDSSYLFFSTPQRLVVRSYALNIEKKILTEIENDLKTLSILDVHNNILLFMETSVIEPSELMIGRFDESSVHSISRNSITRRNPIEGFANFMYDPLEHVAQNDDKVREFNSMYFGPKRGADKSHPLVVTIHGGPHGSYSNLFSIDTAVLALLGFAVLQVNYRGSAGMGADNIEFLQGRIGDVDVKDCVKAVEDALKEYPWLDASRVAICGGSHGGFLVAHLSGQYSDKYRAVVMRNPVIDVATMSTISDIPDWCVSEASGFRYDEVLPRMDSPEATEVFVKMLKCSPIIHVDKVKAPTLVQIGSNDLRVPPSQGKHWYQRLKANGVKTRMHVYDDNHSLASMTAEIDEIINAAIWLMDHTTEKEGLNSIE
ncbi:acylamino-acid-releasing enzyme-like isoform X2 [Venturia canescens]|uniref:acylamino-acid-releasing enzyme-like isoform X2 n=1 Tax=Venturia canescens TaxID=32260 RepID=UPI001C9C3A8C|nr:acylamino-acid-releasing enzyme-like isoform X2 [Venturia canescens]